LISNWARPYDPDLQDIMYDFTLDMFAVEIKSYVTQNYIKIIRDVEKYDPLSDGFVHFQLVK
jgi:hypothetical protein